MKEIRINRLRLENFKCHESLTIEFGGKDTSVFGDNATGKTSIYDGLTWLLFGKDSHGNGEKNIDIKPLDSQGNVKDHQAITAVEAEFEVDGETTTFRRTFHEIWKTKRGCAEATYTGNESEYAVDGVPCKKQNFDDKIKAMVPEDVFRLLTSVSHFASDIKWQQRRAVLFDMTGTLTDREIMEKDGRFTPLAEAMGKLDLSDFKVKVASQRKGYLGVQNDTPVRINECNRTIEEISGIDFQDAHKKEEEIRGAIEGIRKSMTDLEHNDALRAAQMDLRENKMDLQEIERQNQEYRRNQDNGSSKVKELKGLIAIADGRISGDRRFLQAAEQSVQAHDAEIKHLRDKWVEENGKAFAGGICPTCGQPLPFPQLQQASADFEKKKQAKLAELQEKAGHAKEAQENAQSEIQRWTEDIAKTEKALQDYQKQLEEAESGSKPVEDMPGYAETKGVVQRSIDQLQEEINRLMDQGGEEKIKLREEFDAANEQLRFVQKVLAKEGMKEQAEARIETLKAEAKKATEVLQNLDQLAFLIEEFTRFKASFVESSVNDMFMLTRFRMFREQANGGLEERCDVVYDGVPYTGLSTAQQINIGIDIINSLSRHYGVRVPLFVDNAESVTRLEDGKMQTIRLVVSEDDKEIRYEN